MLFKTQTDISYTDKNQEVTNDTELTNDTEDIDLEDDDLQLEHEKNQ